MNTIRIPAKDIRRDTFRSGGKGGQHQNKTDSGVRYTHLPTGISAESREERSQYANDKKALKKLIERLKIHFRVEPEDTISKVLVRTYDFIDHEVTNEKTGKKFRGKVQIFMDKRLDEAIEDQLKSDKTKEKRSGRNG